MPTDRTPVASRPADAGWGVGFDDVAFAPPGGPAIVAGIELHVPAGGFHCLVGRSGCGKTTLLKLAAGLLLPVRGEVTVAGRRLDGPAEAVGFVFQAPTLLEWLPVIENVLLPVALRRRPAAADRERALSLLSRLGLDGLSMRYPEQLSGGQQARVAIARALIDAPRVLLLDEPFAALDALTREELQADLARISVESGATVLLVTHDITEAVYLADSISVMGQGCIAVHFETGMARIRPPGIRYEPPFNTLCREIRAALDGAP